MTEAARAARRVRREEWPFAASMAAAFFLVITSFWILKPLKKGLFLEFYAESGFRAFGLELEAAQAELIAKVANMVVAGFAAVAFGLLSRSLRRERLFLACAAFFLLGDVLFALLLREPGALTVWTFYLYGDLFTTLMVAGFFAFLNDSVSEDAAKRLYGLTGTGGVAGGAVGSLFLASWIDEVSDPGWLVICAGLIGAIALAALAGAHFGRRLPEASRPDAAAAPEPGAEPEEPGWGAALQGARLALRSSYLLAVIGIVGLYELVSTLMDFQFSSAVEHHLEGDAIGAHLAMVFAFTNSAALFVQVFLTSWVMTRFGVGVALLVLPLAAMGGSAAFLIVPTLWTGSLLNTADNAFAYSINQSAKESLYVPTSAEEKYQAKAFIDMFLQRFAKAVAVGLGLGVTIAFAHFDAVRWLSLGTFALLLVWIPAARYAGRRFEEAAAGGGGASR